MGGEACNLLRKSIFTFLKNDHHLTILPLLIAFPYAASALLSQPLVSTSHLFPLVHARLKTLFLAAGFPPSAELFALLNSRLSQAILSFILIQPFNLSFLLLAKASVFRALEGRKSVKTRETSSWISLFTKLLTTQLCNSLLVLSANATCFCLVVIGFNLSEALGFSSPRFLLLMSAIGAVIYSIVLANAYILCSMALTLSGTENKRGFTSILKSCILLRGRTVTALSLAVFVNMALAAIEALFQYRVVKAYHWAKSLHPSMVFEGILVAYMYSLLLALDTVLGYVFLESFNNSMQAIVQALTAKRIQP